MKVMSSEAYQLTEEHHEWTVAVIRKLIRNSHLKISELEELKSAGVFGLIEAAQRYRPGENCQFRSFAYKRIHGALIDHVRRNTKDSRHIFQSQRANNDPTNNAPKASPKKPADLQQIKETALSSWLLDEARHNPEQSLITSQHKKILEGLLAKLPAHKQELIRRHYYDGEEFKSIGHSWNKNSKSWISKLHHQILDELKEHLAKTGYEHG